MGVAAIGGGIFALQAIMMANASHRESNRSNHNHVNDSCEPRQGCCPRHNSIRSSNPHPSLCPTQQPGLYRRFCGSISNVFSSAKSVDAESESSIGVSMKDEEKRPLDVKSSHTLIPAHSVLPYHLSLDNLACIRRKIGSEKKIRFIPELSFKDTAVSDQGAHYRWSNEIYFSDQTFLQRLVFSCHLYRGRDSRPQHFIGCPHQSLTISEPKFGTKNGMVEVQARVTNQPRQCESHSSERWNNQQGQYAQIVVCTICHADAECTLQLDGGLHIRYTCYRDLGSGLDLTDPKWLSLLTGKGSHVRQAHEPNLYKQVYVAANRLQRSDVIEVTHQTPNGIFNVAAATR